MSRLPLFLLAVGACGAPDPTWMFHSMNVEVADGPEATTDAYLDLIENATTSLHVALPAAEDTRLTDALLDADGRGVLVEVVTDWDQQDDAGAIDLLDAGLPVTLANDGIEYFEFSINDDVAWDSTQTIMSHAFVVADSRYVVASTHAGDLLDGERIIIRTEGQELVDDLLLEHNQVFGGSDAVATTAFDGPAKSIVDARWVYPSEDDVLPEMWFGPQERLTKRVIDGVYSAKSSVWILTDDLANSGLAVALQAKAKAGFDIQVVVGPGFGSTSAVQSNLLLSSTPDVQKWQVSTERTPTVVIIDAIPDREGYERATRAMVISHALYSSPRLYDENPNDAVAAVEVLTDQFIDGTLWGFTDASGTPSGAILELIDVFERHRAQGEEL